MRPSGGACEQEGLMTTLPTLRPPADSATFYSARAGGSHASYSSLAPVQDPSLDDPAAYQTDATLMSNGAEHGPPELDPAELPLGKKPRGGFKLQVGAALGEGVHTHGLA